MYEFDVGGIEQTKISYPSFSFISRNIAEENNFFVEIMSDVTNSSVQQASFDTNFFAA